MSRRVWLLIPRVLIALALVLPGWLAVNRAAAQAPAPTGVVVRVGPQDVGLGGVGNLGSEGQMGAVRPGSWTPIRLHIDNNTSRVITVRCQWVFSDIDGDEAQAQRSFTLTPNRKDQTLWLYAALPINTAPNTRTEVRVLEVDPDDEEAPGKLLASQPVVLQALIDPGVQLIGATSSQAMGLTPYTGEPMAQHERVRRVQIPAPSRLPDRWQGLASLQAFIWTPDADEDASAPAISRETREAMREWIRRGGHLIIVWPAVGDPWGGSEFADLITPIKTRRLTGQPYPAGLSFPIYTEKVDLNVFEPRPELTVLTRAGEAKPEDPPVAVAYPYGLGRITVIGIDVSDPKLGAVEARGSDSLWMRVFGWNTPTLTSWWIKGKDDEGRLAAPDLRRTVVLDRAFIPERIAMRETAAGPLGLAVLLFIAYFLLATFVGFGVLKARDQTRHSWVMFVVVAAVTSAIAWGGAMLLRPTRERVAHFSVIDADAASGVVHAHAWASVFSPRHGPQPLTIEGSPGLPNRNLIASPGLAVGEASGGFLDPQRYAYDGAAPHAIDVPFRATAKQLELDYFAHKDDFPLSEQWVMPQGRLTVENGWPYGKLSHNLPGTLRHVKVIYCRGVRNQDTPDAPLMDAWTWDLPDWPAGEVVELKFRPPAQRLAMKTTKDNKEVWEGMLAKDAEAGNGFGDGLIGGANDKTAAGFARVLSFYNAMPPPRYEFADAGEQYTNRPYGYIRSIGRALDISHQLAHRRVIVIGFIDNSPMPIPLRLDGETPPTHARSWTMVRWIATVEEPPAPPPAETQPAVEAARAE